MNAAISFLDELSHEQKYEKKDISFERFELNSINIDGTGSGHVDFSI